MQHHTKTLLIFLSTLFLIDTATAATTAEDMIRLQMRIKVRHSSWLQESLDDSRIVRPSSKECTALIQLLNTKPRPQTLNDADIKYLKHLLDKAIWFGYEQRIMHAILTGIYGTEWFDTEGMIEPSPVDLTP